MELPTLKRQAREAIDRMAGDMIAISRRIQANPEVGYEEVEAAGWLSHFLADQGFNVERGLGNLPTAFRAVKGGGKPVVAFLAEYDALAGVGHGCGHNLIGTGAAGAAVGVASALSAFEQGTIQVIGTPAEEYNGEEEGKIKLLRADTFDGVDVALMWHPWTETALVRSDMAFVALDVIYHGETAHAAADPWNGRNALDGLILAYTNINALRQHIRPDARIHGIVIDGGDAPNIIPDRAAGSFMVRSADKSYLRELFRQVRDCFEASAQATGTRVSVEEITWVDNTRRNRALEDLVLENLEELGYSGVDGRDTGGSTDFGNVSQSLPALSFWMETHREDVRWHSSEVAEGAVSERAHQGMQDAAKALAMTAIDLLAEPRNLQAARQAFAKGGPE